MAKRVTSVLLNNIKDTGSSQRLPHKRSLAYTGINALQHEQKTNYTYMYTWHVPLAPNVSKLASSQGRQALPDHEKFA